LAIPLLVLVGSWWLLGDDQAVVGLAEVPQLGVELSYFDDCFILARRLNSPPAASPDPLESRMLDRLRKARGAGHAQMPPFIHLGRISPISPDSELGKKLKRLQYMFLSKPGWLGYRFSRTSLHQYVTVSVWLLCLIATPLVLPLAFQVRRSFLQCPKATFGHCQSCGYNLTGNISGICPECGTPIPKDKKEPEPTTDNPKE
jgi:hypothetical protein